MLVLKPSQMYTAFRALQADFEACGMNLICLHMPTIYVSQRITVWLCARVPPCIYVHYPKAEPRMQASIKVANDLVTRRQRNRDWLTRYITSCFKAALFARVGGEFGGGDFLDLRVRGQEARRVRQYVGAGSRVLL